jgi:nucleotide-binding universal stress UspA family protein
VKILLATDGSKYGRMAAKKCCQIVSSFEDLEIRILSVVEPAAPIAIDPFGASHEFYLKVKDESKKVAEESVADLKEFIEGELSAGESPQIETRVVTGSPKEMIVEEAKEWDSDLIIVGSHGYGFWGRMLIGSVSDAVIHHAPCSVLVVKGEDSDERDGDEETE